MAIDVVIDEVADNLEEIAEATRRINTGSVGFFLGGAVVGAGIGFYFGYKYNKEKIKAEAFQQSAEEVASIREHYHQKIVAAEPKPPVEEIIQERGYDRPLKPPVPGLVEPRPIRPDPVTKDKNVGWSYAEERETRSASEPYVIHQDEFNENENGYSKVTYTYYTEDDVLVDEENGHPLPHPDLVVGVANLKFGHGTDDPDVVFVRNDRLTIDMEICRAADSYEEKVLGLDNDVDDDDSESD